jgi:hypothetical protein
LRPAQIASAARFSARRRSRRRSPRGCGSRRFDHVGIKPAQIAGFAHILQPARPVRKADGARLDRLPERRAEILVAFEPTCRAMRTTVLGLTRAASAISRTVETPTSAGFSMT